MMRLSFLRFRLVFVFVLAGGFLTGCVTTTTPAARFYVLNPLTPGAGLASDAGLNGELSVEVASLRLPQYLERPQIVTRSSGNRLELAEFDQWGGNLRKNMTRVLAKNFSQVLATPNIAIAPHRPPIPPDFLVELEVMQFERDSHGQVRLSTQWRLSRGKDRMPLATHMTDLSSATVPAGPDFEHTVSAMSNLLGELSQIIGREIVKNVNRSSDP